jgi:phosphoglycolate phosphatase-like HAD superfamily hydrolase
MAIRGVLLDVDGTLVLSNDAHTRAWAQAFAEHGYDIPYERIRPLMGMGGDKLLPALVPDLSDAEGNGKRIAERRKAIFLEQYAPELRAAPGSRQLVERMRDEGLKLVISSSAKSDELEALLKAAQIEGIVRTATTSSEADESKPAPDVVAVSLRKIELPADQVVLLGDSPYDIESAGKVNVGVIAVRCGGFSDERLAGALALYDDPADLLAHYATSPLAGSY